MLQERHLSEVHEGEEKKKKASLVWVKAVLNTREHSLNMNQKLESTSGSSGGPK